MLVWKLGGGSWMLDKGETARPEVLPSSSFQHQVSSIHTSIHTHNRVSSV